MQLHERVVSSPIGPLRLVASGDALVAIDFDGASDSRDGSHPVLDLAERELELYFAGALKEFSVALAPEGTAFQRSVWKALLDVPYGEVRSYAHVARALGSPKAVRAVGAANGRNPIPVIVPCHRIVGASGDLVGYGGGLPRKQWLLGLERGVAGKDRTLDLFARA